MRVTIAWIFLGAILSCVPNRRAGSWVQELILFVATAAIVLADLFATAQLFDRALVLMAGSQKNHKNSVIQASYWGTIKLGSLALLIILFTRGSKIFGLSGAAYDGNAAIDFLSRPGLLVGIATFVVVPLAGGLAWHRQIYRGSH